MLKADYFMYKLILALCRQLRLGAFIAWTLTWSISFLALVPPALASPPEIKGPNGLILQQTNKMVGECDVSMSNLGMRITVRKTRLIFLFLPPYNEAVCFSRTSGKILRCPMKSFRNAFSTSMTIFAAFTLEDARLKRVGRVKQGVFDLVKFETTTEFERMQMERLKNQELSGNSPHHLVLLAADKLPYDPRMAALLERVYGLPKTGLIPISVRYKTVQGEDSVYLTTSNSKPIKIDAAAMQIPAGLKPAKDLQEILETKSSPEAMDLMMLK